MKIEVGQKGQLILKEIHESVTLIAADGNQLFISMRDTGFEVVYSGLKYEFKDGHCDSCGSTKKTLTTSIKMKKRTNRTHTQQNYR